MARTFRPEVERYRPIVQRYFLPQDVDKALWTIHVEHMGDPRINVLQFDSRGNQAGPASGLFQIEGSDGGTAAGRGRPTMQQLLDPETNVRVASFLVYNTPQGWGHWGEGPGGRSLGFGGLGRHPYPGDPDPPRPESAAPVVEPEPVPEAPLAQAEAFADQEQRPLERAASAGSAAIADTLEPIAPQESPPMAEPKENETDEERVKRLQQEAMGGGTAAKPDTKTGPLTPAEIAVMPQTAILEAYGSGRITKEQAIAVIASKTASPTPQEYATRVVNNFEAQGGTNQPSAPRGAITGDLGPGTPVVRADDVTPEATKKAATAAVQPRSGGGAPRGPTEAQMQAAEWAATEQWARENGFAVRNAERVQREQYNPTTRAYEMVESIVGGELVNTTTGQVQRFGWDFNNNKFEPRGDPYTVTTALQTSGPQRDVYFNEGNPRALRRIFTDTGSEPVFNRDSGTQLVARNAYTGEFNPEQVGTVSGLRLLNLPFAPETGAQTQQEFQRSLIPSAGGAVLTNWSSAGMEGRGYPRFQDRGIAQFRGFDAAGNPFSRGTVIGDTANALGYRLPRFDDQAIAAELKLQQDIEDAVASGQDRYAYVGAIRNANWMSQEAPRIQTFAGNMAANRSPTGFFTDPRGIPIAGPGLGDPWGEGGVGAFNRQPIAPVPVFDQGTPPQGVMVSRPKYIIDAETGEIVGGLAMDGDPEVMNVTPVDPAKRTGANVIRNGIRAFDYGGYGALAAIGATNPEEEEQRRRAQQAIDNPVSTPATPETPATPAAPVLNQEGNTLEENAANAAMLADIEARQGELPALFGAQNTLSGLQGGDIEARAGELASIIAGEDDLAGLINMARIRQQYNLADSRRRFAGLGPETEIEAPLNADIAGLKLPPGVRFMLQTPAQIATRLANRGQAQRGVGLARAGQDLSNVQMTQGQAGLTRGLATDILRLKASAAGSSFAARLAAALTGARASDAARGQIEDEQRRAAEEDANRLRSQIGTAFQNSPWGGFFRNESSQ